MDIPIISEDKSKNEQNLLDMINNTLKDEIFEGNNKYYCSGC